MADLCLDTLATGAVVILAGAIVMGGPDGVPLAEAELVGGLQVAELPLHEGVEVRIAVRGDERAAEVNARPEGLEVIQSLEASCVGGGGGSAGTLGLVGLCSGRGRSSEDPTRRGSPGPSVALGRAGWGRAGLAQAPGRLYPANPLPSPSH